jgi:pimeloyl-ACP methyl ester carboxylesterase
VRGEHDQVEPPKVLEANLLPVIPGARMTVIEDTGHLLPPEAPGPVASLLSEFAAAAGQ